MSDMTTLTHFDHRQYATRLPLNESVAYMSVLMFLVALAHVSKGTMRVHWVSMDDMHRHYPGFGSLMGVWPDLLKTNDKGQCEAVLIFCRIDKICNQVRPVIIKDLLNEYEDLVLENSQREEILNAARVVCADLLPAWQWQT